MKQEIYFMNKQLEQHEALLKLEKMLTKMEDKVIYQLQEEEEWVQDIKEKNYSNSEWKTAAMK